jgi:hypothetical protein
MVVPCRGNGLSGCANQYRQTRLWSSIKPSSDVGYLEVIFGPGRQVPISRVTGQVRYQDSRCPVSALIRTYLSFSLLICSL